MSCLFASIWRRLRKFLPFGPAGLLSALCLVVVAPGDLRNPGWSDPNGIGSAPDWHYRIPVSVAAGAAIHSTIRFDVDFNAQLALMGVSGDVDDYSPRIVRPDGSPAAIQQYTDGIYAGAGDALNNGRGEIRFLLEDDGPAIYYLYFDILQNGVKPPWNSADTINGNFEFSIDGQQDPPGWDGRNWQSYHAAAMADDWGHTVTSAGGTWLLPLLPSDRVTTDETAHTGEFCYLMGARDQDEQGNPNNSARLQRLIEVPAVNPGRLRLHYRVKGWSSSSDGSNNHDFIRMFILSGGTNNYFVGPEFGSYTSRPFSPNLGTGAATFFSSGYRQYNGWDTTTSGFHLNGMSVAPGSEPWFEAEVDLSPYAGQSITLTIETHNRPEMKSWFHIDDVEWSLSEGTLGAPEAFGVNLLAPNDTGAAPATIYAPGERLSIQARMDAAPASVSGDLFAPGNLLITGGVRLFNDGTHGDLLAGDAVWSNDGSVPADPTYTFQSGDTPGTGWRVVVYARDNASSTIGAPDGLAHIPGRPVLPVDQPNFYNVDAQIFTLVTPARLVLDKSVITYSDPVNGSTNPKAIPGAEMEYFLTARNLGGKATDADSVFLVDAIPEQTALYVGDLGAPTPSGPIIFSDGSVASGLTYIYRGLEDDTDDVSFSNNGGLSFGYTPQFGTDGFDDRITHIRISPKGAFNGANGGDIPSFTVRFRVRVK